MIKKLRKRFVRLSVSLISVVLIMFYIFTSAVLFFRITETVQDTLKNYSSEKFFLQFFDLGSDSYLSEADNYAIDARSICVVDVNDLGSIGILDIGHGHIDQKILDTSVKYVVDSNYDFGLIMKYNLFYYKTETVLGYRIAFADSSRYFLYLQEILVEDAGIFIFILLVLYFLVWQLSKILIKPVQRAWTQQQNFIADASHELKTPLTVILANCDILSAHKDDTVNDQHKWIESTNEEATHMKELVDKMLFLAKSESMKPHRVNGEVDISELATKLVLQFEPVAYEAGVELVSDIERGIILKTDQTAVNQIIHILLDNAVKYAGLGGRAELRLKKKNNAVYLSAKNTGAPIPEEDLPHIFERFYRSDKARTAGSGYGLGLAICKSLAEQQKANISVTSNERDGTVFTVKFRKKFIK
ncbi:MAG: HAMP domain-containing histidine kinase [Oscillospiraceae bacterium]|nr:HAMP domain-containing histidine kinase [Oscillospiraceae bacterium]